MRHGEIQAILLGNEERLPRAGRRRYVGHAREAVCVLILKHVDEAFAAAHIEALPRRVVEQIVRVADDVERSELLAACGVDEQNFRRPATTDEEPAVRLVE